MLVVGDADGLPPSHAVEFFNLLGGGLRDAGWDGSGVTRHRLAVLPGVTHYDINVVPGARRRRHPLPRRRFGRSLSTSSAPPNRPTFLKKWVRC